MRESSNSQSRYAIYLRCSTDDQGEGDFTTIDVQRDLNREHVSNVCGTVFNVYCDEGISGTTLNRPGWKRLLADAQARKFDAVVITYMSRLGRGDAYTVAEWQLREANVRV